MAGSSNLSTGAVHPEHHENPGQTRSGHEHPARAFAAPHDGRDRLDISATPLPTELPRGRRFAFAL